MLSSHTKDPKALSVWKELEKRLKKILDPVSS